MQRLASFLLDGALHGYYWCCEGEVQGKPSCKSCVRSALGSQRGVKMTCVHTTVSSHSLNGIFRNLSFPYFAGALIIPVQESPLPSVFVTY